jgi:hypothetical protein
VSPSVGGHIERNGLMRVATEAPNFEIEVTSVQRVTQCRRWLRWSMRLFKAALGGLAAWMIAHST